MKTLWSIIKKIILWVLSVFFVLIGLVYFPSASGLLAFAVVVLIIPIQKWQRILQKVIKGKLKAIFALVLSFAMLACVPTVPETEGSITPTDAESIVATTIIPEMTNEATSIPTIIPTATPTFEPTEEPTTAPTITPNPTSTPIPVLKERSSGQAVVELQKRLIELNYLDGEADGEFGSGTKKALIEFQKNNNLTADGVAGESTQTILYSSNAVRQRWVWIPTNGGKKYHSRSSCSNMENPKRVTYREAIERGFDSCGRCY